MPIPWASVTSAMIKEVAKKHVIRFQNLIEKGNAGVRGIRVDECEGYLFIWKSIYDKNGENLDGEEMNEVQDAWFSGDYDEDFK